MMKVKGYLIIILMLFINIWLFAEGEGGVTLPILNYIPGARAMGLGTAYTALADDVTSLYWNPAGLAGLIRQELSGLYEKLYGDSSFMFFGYSLPVWNIGTFAAGIVNLTTDNIFAISEYKEELGVYSDNQFMFILSYGTPFNRIKNFKKPYLNFLDVGASLKLVKHSIENYSAFGIAFDIGIKYLAPKSVKFLENFTFGLLLQNILPPSHKLVEREWFPLKLKFGVNYKLFYNTLLLNFDISQIFFRNTSPEINFGLEYIAMRMFKFRVGYKTGISAGLGMSIQDFNFDYALNFNYNLGMTHQFSASYKFGGPLKK
jgi:hypothetical protein